MEYIDTHTHLSDEAFQADVDRVIASAVEAGVSLMILPGTSLDELPAQKALAARYPERLRMFLGLHPTELTDDPDGAVQTIETELAANRALYCGIGEIGIDLHEAPDTLGAQMQAFDRQCRMAIEAGLPINIHCRDGLDATLEVLSGLPKLPPGAFHCFGGTPADVEKIRRIAPGYYFGINGIVTFKNSGLRDTLPAIGLDHIILETDAPYLAPTPYRGKRNDSSHIPLISHCIADTLGISEEEVAATTTASARTLYNL